MKIKKKKYLPVALSISIILASGFGYYYLFGTAHPEIQNAADIRSLTDAEYPDNPNIEIRSALSDSFNHARVEFEELPDGQFNVRILPANAASDTLILHNINLLEWIPTFPLAFGNDSALRLVGIVNQEWNRMEVNFPKEQFEAKGSGSEKTILSQVHLANNCLRAGLWEVITFTEENSTNKPCWQGWFEFPKPLYEKLFRKVNSSEYAAYSPFLDDWKTPAAKINPAQWRNIVSEQMLPAQNKNTELYALAGERKKKQKNIVYPLAENTIYDFLNDSTRFSTFSPPGIYRRDDPRITYLSKLRNLEKLIYRKVSMKGAEYPEFELVFQNPDGKIITRWMIGGFDMSNVPVLPETENYKGYQMPMGIGNHSFYEDYDRVLKNKSADSRFYSLLMDDANNWVDSHEVGIDGSLLHFDAAGNLHFWILSFERHALVGHYVFKLPVETAMGK